MDSKHTPGPWTVKRGNEITSTSGICTALALSPDGEWKDIREEHEANARLIAAAPELLAACEAMLDAYDTVVNKGDPSKQFDAATLALAAIAKATGQQ